MKNNKIQKKKQIKFEINNKIKRTKKYLFKKKKMKRLKNKIYPKMKMFKKKMMSKNKKIGIDILEFHIIINSKFIE